jgi:nucleoside-diphosphate-sugar epimerase
MPFAVLVAVENLYVYGPHEGRDLREDTPMLGRGSRSSTRVAMTLALEEAHRRGDVRVVRVRASDLIGPGVRVSLAGATLIEPILAGRPRVSLMAAPDLPHSLTYAPHFGRALLHAGSDPAAQGLVFHAPCAPAVTPRALVAMIAREAGVAAPRIAALPRGLLPVALPLLGVAVPAMRGIGENASMFYERFVVDDTRYQRAYHAPATPLAEVIRETVRGYVDARLAAVPS